MSYRHNVESELIQKFLADLSKELLNVENFPNLSSFAFWIRKAKQKQILKSLEMIAQAEGERRVPVGRIFQIAPNNVDSLFLYVWALALLSGNKVVTKLGSQESGEQGQALELIEIVRKRNGLSSGIWRFFRSNHEDQLIDDEMAASDLVVAWGSDETIRAITSRASEAGSPVLSFPHRISAICLNGDMWAKQDEKQRASSIASLSKDIKAFDQGACTSPKALVIVAADDETFFSLRQAIEAQEVLFDSDASAIQKLQTLVNFSATSNLESNPDPGRIGFLAPVLGFTKISEINEAYCRSGVIPIIRCTEPRQIANVLDRPLQTISHFGFDQNSLDANILGSNQEILRTCPVGRAHNFHWIWEGVNLLTRFTRSMVSQ